MKIDLKHSVSIKAGHLRPEIYKIIFAAWCTAPKFEDDTLWITSANDGEHMDGSLHYDDAAFDFRIRNIVGYKTPTLDSEGKVRWKPNQAVVLEWCRKMRVVLGDDYDVIYEPSHIHIERDPRG